MIEAKPGLIGELLRSMFEVLWNRPDGVPAQEILNFLPASPPPPESDSVFSPVERIPENERVLRLATLPLVQAGWLVKDSKGRWFITDEGRQACRKYPNAQQLYKEAVRLHEDREKSAPLYSMALEQAQERAWEMIRRFLQETPRVEFQSLAVELLQAMGYHVAWVAPPEKVHGQIDMLAYVDPVGAKGPRILIQIKTKGQAVTLEGLKTFISVLGPSDYGLFISTGGFTSDVSEQIRANAFQKITLLDLAAFFDLWLKYYDQLSRAARSRFPLKAVYFLSGLDS